jgi:hypothetical protein
MENVSKNLQIVVKSETGDNTHKFATDYLGEERSDKLRAWINGTRVPNLAELDKFVTKYKIATGKDLSLDWLVYNKGEMFTKYEEFVEESRIIRKELELLKEEYGAFKKMALANFPNVDTNNQFADNIDAFSELNVLDKNFWIGQAYYSDLAGNA